MDVMWRNVDVVEECVCNVDVLWSIVDVLWSIVDVMWSNVEVMWTLHISTFHNFRQVFRPLRSVILKYANVDPAHLKVDNCVHC